jgi:hypothetical protein
MAHLHNHNHGKEDHNHWNAPPNNHNVKIAAANNGSVWCPKHESTWIQRPGWLKVETRDFPLCHRTNGEGNLIFIFIDTN